MSALTVHIPEDFKQQLEDVGRRRQQPAGDLVLGSLRRYLAEEEPRLLREKLRPNAEARGFLSDENVFNAVS